MNVTVGSYTGMGREEIKREREQIPSYVAVFSLEKKKNRCYFQDAGWQELSKILRKVPWFGG